MHFRKACSELQLNLISEEQSLEIEFVSKPKLEYSTEFYRSTHCPLYSIYYKGVTRQFIQKDKLDRERSSILECYIFAIEVRTPFFLARSTPFHLVDASPWPIISAISRFLLLSSLCDFIHSRSVIRIVVRALATILVTRFWWRDVSREACLRGFHNPPIQVSLRMAIIWFISSEVLFFFGFF